MSKVPEPSEQMRCIGCGEKKLLDEFRTTVEGKPWLARNCYDCRFGKKLCPICKKTKRINRASGTCYSCHQRSPLKRNEAQQLRAVRGPDVVDKAFPEKLY